MADPEFDETSLKPNLFQEKAGLFVAPIRHHSPACAWAVRDLIRSVKPKEVLIEAPIDFEPHIDLLLDSETTPPIAIVTLVKGESKSRCAVAYYPFCAHSPEFVAMQTAREVGAAIRFIDLPSGAKAMLRADREGALISLTDEQYFGSGTYVDALCRRTGCRNGFELWDHLFEARLGEQDWRTFLNDAGTYCAGLRAATPRETIISEGDAAREAHMKACIEGALKNGSVVAVVGGFHAPALTGDEEAISIADQTTKPAEADSYVIRYGFKALDALNGYGAGLPQPGYYQGLWDRANEADGVPDIRAYALDLCSQFARDMREKGHLIAVPTLVELLRSAEGLALMRGRKGVSRYDLFDAVRTALTKGEISINDAWTERFSDFLCGTALGNIPFSAGSPPLVEDARLRAKQNRIDLSDGARRRRKLDVHRNDAHRKASQFFHAMGLLGTGFAECETGPDFLNGVNTDRLFEEWSYAWSPQVEGRLIELAGHGDQLLDACLQELMLQRETDPNGQSATDIERSIILLGQGILAGIGERLPPFVRALEGDAQTHPDFCALGNGLQKLIYIARSKSPMGAPESLDLTGLSASIYRRLIFLMDGFGEIREEDVQRHLETLRLVADLLSGDAKDEFDNDLFIEAVDRLLSKSLRADVLGGVLAITVQAGRRPESTLIDALKGHFEGSSIDLEDRLGVLRGLMTTAPTLLWQSRDILDAVDGFISSLEEADFISLLPHMRLAFSALNPREIDLVAGTLSRMHGGSLRDFSPGAVTATEEELQLGLALNEALKTSLQKDGLGDWLEADT